MATALNEELVRNITTNVTVPLVFRQFVSNWSISQWNVEKWSTVFGDREIPFRCMRKDFISDEPCWERKCKVKKLTFKNFINNLAASKEWMYFDYKYLHQWFDADSELCKELSWKQFGYDKGAADTTLWMGSEGSHTPAHQDTYGYNIIAQVHGKKRWILFPPETGGLKPTRVPYEESSVYSELNFFCPHSLDVFNGLTGGRMVELSAGDALVVPRGWWHYVQNIDPVNITLNMWLPHEKDPSAHVSEALIKIFIAQMCKDLPLETAKMLVNPNEDDIVDTPLAVLFLQLETVANTYMDKKRRVRRVKRQKTRDDDSPLPDLEEFDLKGLVGNPGNNMEIAPSITSADLMNVLKDNLSKYANTERALDDDELDGATSSLCLTKAVIDAFSQNDVIDLVKHNLLARLS
ncbi:HSPB1-associated protein 1 [Zerene cesonia]|uniref:HSPB1-associated protein 1 n=1 Tax=Zerene cesonia TaxID=33412 RepID=UPI0018E5A240|nr:HSPB1-associated protein 1 [Zerene cesonia]